MKWKKTQRCSTRTVIFSAVFQLTKNIFRLQQKYLIFIGSDDDDDDANNFLIINWVYLLCLLLLLSNINF